MRRGERASAPCPESHRRLTRRFPSLASSDQNENPPKNLRKLINILTLEITGNHRSKNRVPMFVRRCSARRTVGIVTRRWHRGRVPAPTEGGLVSVEPVPARSRQPVPVPLPTAWRALPNANSQHKYKYKDIYKIKNKNADTKTPVPYWCSVHSYTTCVQHHLQWFGESCKLVPEAL